MFTSEFLPLLKLFLPFCHFFKCITFQHDKTKGSLVSIKLARHLRIVRFQSYLSGIYFIALFMNLCFGPLTLIDKLRGLGFCGMFLTCVVGRWDINAENNLLQIIKTFLYFEADVMKGGWNIYMF